ncbi:hypothetical protein [Clostridium sp.]|uniref:hypothetical protein n=1 Tax=Clostridium sp. TaxID=1506 RepID=UPI00321647E3
MKYKYGYYPSFQVHDYKKKIHSLIHWLLIYKEENEGILNRYFEAVQYKLNGFNELMGYPTQMIEIMNLIESARNEFNKENCNNQLYRHTILDIHALIDRLPEED